MVISKHIKLQQDQIKKVRPVVLTSNYDREVINEDINRLQPSQRLVLFMVFNATFNNISVILWRSVLLVEETGVHGENQRPVTSH